jgi:hypothetical protein
LSRMNRVRRAGGVLSLSAKPERVMDLAGSKVDQSGIETNRP